MATQNLTEYGFYNYTRMEDSYREERVNISFGQGFNVQGSIGYLFNRNFGLELGASYLLGSTSEIDFNYLASSTNPNSSEVNYELSAQMYRINPSLVLKAKFRTISPYAKMGLIAGIGEVNFRRESKSVFSHYRSNFQVFGGISWGLSASMGANYAINRDLDLYAELNIISMSYAPSKGLVTEYMINGENRLHSLTTEDKEVEFVEENTVDYNSPDSPDEPSSEVKHSLPFSSIGLNIGLSYKF